MKIVVIGGTGRIGSRLVFNLRQEDCRILAASRATGVDTMSGVGLAQAVAGAGVVVDVTNVRSLDGAGALPFFETSTRNIVAAARAAGVRHYIVLSIVGVDRLPDIDYFRAKEVQERMVGESGIPHTILRSTQFFEFISDVVQDGTERDIPISPAFVQPIAGNDVANALADTALMSPFNGVLEIAGPERFRLSDVATEIATAHEDGRGIVVDRHARYFGAELEDETLLPGADAYIAHSKFDDWLRDSLQPYPRAVMA